MVGKRLCHYTNVIYLKARFGKGSIHSDRYRYIEMRGYNPYAVKLLALALFIVPLLRKGVTPQQIQRWEYLYGFQCENLCKIHSA